LFDLWRHHAFFTTTDVAVADTITADRTHRGHAITEQVHAVVRPARALPAGLKCTPGLWPDDAVHGEPAAALVVADCGLGAGSEYSVDGDGSA
jgi:hypothetical protein